MMAVKRWRAEQGPDKDVMLAQRHRPGEAAQTDFTWATALGVTIAGEAFAHMLCVFVLPYSNWRWATVCMSLSPRPERFTSRMRPSSMTRRRSKALLGWVRIAWSVGWARKAPT